MNRHLDPRPKRRNFSFWDRRTTGRTLVVTAILSLTAAPWPAVAGAAKHEPAEEVSPAVSPVPAAGGTTEDVDDVHAALARLAGAQTSDEIGLALSDPALWDVQAIRPVAKYLQQPDLAVADQAAIILETVGTEASVAELEKALKRPIPPESKRRLLAALYYLRFDGDVFPGLVAALHDADPDVRGDAAEFLGELGNPKAIPPLSQQLKKEQDPKARKSLTWAIAFLKDETQEGPAEYGKE